ncbi:MAG: hypothetical protein O3A63_22005 [Proteobacteria bacterium]|nr:hypothetical protein [Pseudomonadota bacterium]
MSIEQCISSIGGEVLDLSPGFATVRLQQGNPPVEVRSETGWTALTSNLVMPFIDDPATQPFCYLPSQMCHPNVKFALVIDDATWLQLRAELPLDPTRSDDNDWLRGTLSQFVDVQTNLQTHSKVTDQKTDQSLQKSNSNDAEILANRASIEHIQSIVADLGFTAVAVDETCLKIEVGSRNQLRRVVIQTQAQSCRVSLPIGTGDAITLKEPMKRAVGRFLLCCSADLRFVRPYARTHGDESTDAVTIGFEVHLPPFPRPEHVDHALKGLITATQQYETEIENLATEAILSSAYLRLTGGSAATPNLTNQ